MQTLTTERKEASAPASPALPGLAAIKAKQKATWESGDYGQIGHSIEHIAQEFMDHRPLRPGAQVLDVACGTGNLAVIAARQGCQVSGVDIATNLLDQARARAAAAGLSIAFQEADAEAMPFPNESFDLAVSMFGVMFTPQPAIAIEELRRVTRPEGQLGLANWTPEGFIGQMFRIFKKHLPPPPAGVPSPMEWGTEGVVQERLRPGFKDVRLTRRMAIMRFSFPPAETVEFFRKYYGPTLRAFESLPTASQQALRRDLVELQTRHNQATVPGTTQVAAEYLDVAATRR